MNITKLLYDFLYTNSHYAIFLSIIISILIAILGLIPSFFITGANILLFGPINGFFLSLIGEVCGAAISFILYRIGFKDKLNNSKIHNSFIDKLYSKKGLHAGILIFQGRLLPFIPSGIVTFAASISEVNFIIFIFSTTIGKIPSIALESIIAFDLINFSSNWLRLAIIILAIIPTFLYKNKFSE